MREPRCVLNCTFLGFDPDSFEHVATMSRIDVILITLNCLWIEGF